MFAQQELNIICMLNVKNVQESVYESLREGEKELANILLSFTDFFPREKLEGCSSIASKNIYPKDEEIKELGSVYDKLSRVSLLEHIFHVREELDTLFSRYSKDVGLSIHIGDKRLGLDGIDYFILLVAVLYHDVGKSPEILRELGYTFEEYRKSDHAFWSGEYLKRVKKEIEEFYGVKVPEEVFSKIYSAVVSHHSLVPKDKYGLVLKELDKKARERELHFLNTTLKVEEKKKFLTEEELSVISFPEEIIKTFIEYISQKADKRFKNDGKTVFYWFYHPPYIYVNSLLVRKILLDALNEKGISLKDKQLVKLLSSKENSVYVAQALVKDLYYREYVKDVKPPFGGRYYLITQRDGTESLFYGIPILAEKTPNFFNLKPSLQVVSVKPLSKRELEEIKKLK